MARYALVAGEASGDALGAGLIRELKALEPDAEFSGVAGPRMAAAGCRVIEPVDSLSVMGLVEVVRHLPRLLRLRRNLAERLLRDRPDCVVGIDAPDFNLGLERRLRRSGIPTVHYVSPSVWAWRSGRVRTIAAACDKVLCLFPFEKASYRNAGVQADYVGHPLADEIPLAVDRDGARSALSLPAEGAVVALLPGSRAGEAARLATGIAGAARLIAARHPGVKFVAPMANDTVRRIFEAAIARNELQSEVTLTDGRVHEVLSAADVAIVASGTATLEALLFKCPMVVAYRVAPLTHFLLRQTGMLRISRFALPNIIAGRSLVPELMQGQANAESLAASTLAWLDDHARAAAYRREAEHIHESLRRGADRRAAEAVRALVAARTLSGIRHDAD